MPLSFRSQSHGNIAFGFFNIESDMLLLENHFFFADKFCDWIKTMANEDDAGLKKFEYQVYTISDPNDVGDLMGAIHGIRFKGFIGELYKLFPFPADPKDFKQNPKGYQTQDVVKSQIEGISKKTKIFIEFLPEEKVCIGPYLFEKSVLYELIQYVWQGGYPLWKNEVRPQYVVEMKKCIQKTNNIFFKGVFS
ncbi:MAG: hypothetical protein GY699_05370 [Desulfobacteraceae bacterium]|nr:hypothetical protein [Desulfobacteraceae bacterium]